MLLLPLGMLNTGRMRSIYAVNVGSLPSIPDAATGLVHLGGGRWYDPAVGRPLQPNPAGGAVVVAATVHDGYCTGAKAACEPCGEQLSVGDIVRITIRDVDSERGRISLGLV